MQFGKRLAAPDAGKLGVIHESAGICKAHLPQLQDYSAPRYCARDLFRSASQAASGLIGTAHSESLPVEYNFSLVYSG